MSWGRVDNEYIESYMGDFSEPTKFSFFLANYVCIQNLLKYIEMQFSFPAFQCQHCQGNINLKQTLTAEAKSFHIHKNRLLQNATCSIWFPIAVATLTKNHVEWDGGPFILYILIIVHHEGKSRQDLRTDT